jgi:hypothetical protein
MQLGIPSPTDMVEDDDTHQSLRGVKSLWGYGEPIYTQSYSARSTQLQQDSWSSNVRVSILFWLRTKRLVVVLLVLLGIVKEVVMVIFFHIRLFTCCK